MGFPDKPSAFLAILKLLFIRVDIVAVAVAVVPPPEQETCIDLDSESSNFSPYTPEKFDVLVYLVFGSSTVYLTVAFQFEKSPTILIEFVPLPEYPASQQEKKSFKYQYNESLNVNFGDNLSQNRYLLFTIFNVSRLDP